MNVRICLCNSIYVEVVIIIHVQIGDSTMHTLKYH